jgi:phytoene desaturase
MPKRILIVGAGPGGLTTGMLLAAGGHRVEVFEKNPHVGGRNAALRLGPYTFDTGPTFLMLVQGLEEIFADCGRELGDYLDLKKIDPLYRLRFPGGKDFFPSDDEARMVADIERLFPGEGAHYRRYKAKEGKKLDRVYPCLRHPYLSPLDFLRWGFLRALPHIDAFASVYDRLASYFDAEFLRIAMTFQAKYLGMSPWKCPATFTILSLIEQRWGIFHPIGGLSAISGAMAKVIGELGGSIRLNAPVKEVVVKGRRAMGLVLEGGEAVEGDAVVINPDFAWAMKHLVKPEHRRQYTDERLARMEYSCSTFMLYLGLDTTYDLPHHNVVFADDYHRNVGEIVESKVLSGDPSFYVQNASATDPTLAPAGHSAVYVLVPVPNQTSGIDWVRETPGFRDLVLRRIREKTELTDLDRHLVMEKVLTPADWERDYHIYNGATFNLSHTINQMLYFRPHNRLEEFDGCYIVGGGTHPGSGLPTIYQSGRIAADLIGE